MVAPVTHESLFKEARSIAQHCILPASRDLLRQRTDECEEIFDRFNISASRRDMEALVAAWTRLLIAMKSVGPMASDPCSSGGRLPVPKSQAA